MSDPIIDSKVCEDCGEPAMNGICDRCDEWHKRNCCAPQKPRATVAWAASRKEAR